MNRTASGSIAAGAPNSVARYVEEARHALDNQYQLLLLTDEGKELLSRFFRSVGSDFSQMSSEVASNEIEREQKALFCFLSGVSFLGKKILS